MIKELALALAPTIEEIFSTMLATDVTPIPVAPGGVGTGKTFFAMIGLTGVVSAGIQIQFPEAVAVGLTQSMLCSDESPDEPTLVDALGELANLVAGGLKNRSTFFADHPLTLPSVVAGNNFAVFPPKKVLSQEFGFQTPGGGFLITLFLKS